MTLRAYLILMIIATLAFWLAFGIIVLNVEPAGADWLSLGVFYLLLIFALTGTGSIIGFVIRFLALRRELVAKSVLVAFRQALLAALLVAAVLFLFSQKLFSWLNVGLLIVALSTLEFFLLSSEHQKLAAEDTHTNE